MVDLAQQCLQLEQTLAGDDPEPTALMAAIDGALTALHDRLGEEVPAHAAELIPLAASGNGRCATRWRHCWCKAIPP